MSRCSAEHEASAAAMAYGRGSNNDGQAVAFLTSCRRRPNHIAVEVEVLIIVWIDKARCGISGVLAARTHEHQDKRYCDIALDIKAASPLNILLGPCNCQ